MRPDDDGPNSPEFLLFAHRYDNYCCPATQALIDALMAKINEIRALARAAQRRNKKEACMAFDDMGDELVLMLNKFLEEAEAQREDCEPGPEIGSN